jgi:rubredoxin
MAETNRKTATRAWMCLICGWIYYEHLGSREEHIAPGTRWEDIPDDWQCPDCTNSKEDFVVSSCDARGPIAVRVARRLRPARRRQKNSLALLSRPALTTSLHSLVRAVIVTALPSQWAGAA